MEQTFKEKLKRLEDHSGLLTQSLHGLEKECLRVSSEGQISQKRHPVSLGSTLMHPFISTDFSEAQLELITPPFPSQQQLMEFLKLLHRYVYRNLDDESIWPFSAPCALLGDIPIARYGTSNFAFEKELYRVGLHHRYGSQMQALSGVHYNFSFSDDLIQLFEMGSKSEFYLHIVRNYLRFGWLMTYLFGASPVYDESFFRNLPDQLTTMAPKTVGTPFATSLRMSEYGYYSKVQTQIGISFNSFDRFLQELHHAVTTPNEAWKGIPKGCQINDHIIQIEAEHYTRIRPKPPVNHQLRPLENLKQNGITYLEVRGMDLDPWTIEGVTSQHLRFQQIFLLYCLLKESPPLSHEEEKELIRNQNLVALSGRDPHLSFPMNGQEKSLKNWGSWLLEQMTPFAEILNRSFQTEQYTQILQEQFDKIHDSELTPSAKLLRELVDKNMSFQDYGLALAEQLKTDAMIQILPQPFQIELDKLAVKSLEDQKDLEHYDDFILKGYEDLELSTQAVLREAFKRGIEVEELDRKDHFFRLKQDNYEQTIKRATMTSLDSLMSYLQMENKQVTKKLLFEKGFSVPEGILCFNPKEALNHFQNLKHHKLVIKPNRMNYGIGIYTVEKEDLKGYETAIGLAFEHGQEVVIEKFLDGQEYRFLVINSQVAAICQRIPANVIGDGIHTIRELIDMKNQDLRYYKIPKYYLRAGKEEEDVLSHLGLTFEAVPKEGEQVFLRENSNVSTGGDSIDMTDEVHKGYAKIAAGAADVVNAVFCGVDMIIRDIQQQPTSDNHGIIELNFNPALWIHRYPTFGKPRMVEQNVLDALGF